MRPWVGVMLHVSTSWLGWMRDPAVEAEEEPWGDMRVERPSQATGRTAGSDQTRPDQTSDCG